ncbi:MAG: hypothetical protein H6729_04890 [Deltaproteobacteria bacterium]|nr:hypothetical protein [Deltaproteobacteria bacterium]
MRESSLSDRVPAMRGVGLVALVVGALVLPSLWAGPVAFGQRARQPRRVIRIGEQRIKGRIQKPEAFYILQRSNLNFEGLELKTSFVPKIIKSVDQASF